MTKAFGFANASVCLVIGARSLAAAMRPCSLLLLVSAAAFPTQAAIDVTPMGQAAVQLPLPAPPGIAGMTPKLSLSYADGGINGPLGVGWSLGGVSTITRCPSTRPVDGVARAVEFDGNDRLCLDGQRLIRTDASGVPPSPLAIDDALGSAGTREYRTEVDSFSRIRAYLKPGAAAAEGPSYFKVWTKSGLVQEYGPSGNDDAGSLIKASTRTSAGSATPIAVWALSRISDTAGNYIDFKYEQRTRAWGSGVGGPGDGKEWNLAEVQYTGRPGQAPTNKMVFKYDDRLENPPTAAADRSEAYHKGNKNVSIRRLAAVRTYVNSPNPGELGAAAGAVGVHTIHLAYENSSATGRSRLASVRHCRGGSAADEGVCLPASRFEYADAAAPVFSANAAFAASPMATLEMLNASHGGNGILTGDFDGDGRTDILQWSDAPVQNRLFRSLGNGAFSEVTGLNIATELLGKRDGCVSTLVADFNGDGLSDMLRTPNRARYGTSGCDESLPSKLFLSRGNASFMALVVPATINLLQVSTEETVSYPPDCTVPMGLSPVGVPAEVLMGLKPPRAGMTLAPNGAGSPTSAVKPDVFNCANHFRSAGRRFHILDLNGDGVQDLLTTIAPEYWVYFDGAAYWWHGFSYPSMPTEDQLCGAHPGGCTKVYKGVLAGDGSIAFELQPTNVSATSLYSNRPSGREHPYWRQVDLADLNGDGLLDVLSQYSGRWTSRGDFTFSASDPEDTLACTNTIDFNGDGRADCLYPAENASAQFLTTSYRPRDVPNVIVIGMPSYTQFNVNGPGDNLLGWESVTVRRQTIGHLVEDFDGDGRQDILRWGQSAADNGIYLSNGDATFRTRTPAGLGALPGPLQAADGTRAFVLGDFLGQGRVQILHLKHAPNRGSMPGSSNQLYQLATPAFPVDSLRRVISPTGLVSTVQARSLLTAGDGRYSPGRVEGVINTSPHVDLQLPISVITTTSQDTGSGTLTAQYRYAELKAERGGRGMLGFRKLQRQTLAPDGTTTLTASSEYLQQHPYIGMVSKTLTVAGGFEQTTPFLSSGENVYCDKTAASTGGASAGAPCQTTALVTRPYLARSTVVNHDPANAVLQTVMTQSTYNNFGDPTQVKVTTSGLVDGAARSYVKTNDNTYGESGVAGCPHSITGDNWIIGRLCRSTVTSEVPDILLSAEHGGSPTAALNQGTLTAPSANVQFVPSSLPAFPNTAVGQTSAAQSVVLTNNRTSAITAVVVSAGSNFIVTSPACAATLAANGGSCTIQVAFKPTVAGPLNGSLQVSFTGGSLSLPLSGQGTSAPVGDVTLTPATLPAFPNTTVGQTSSAQTLVLANGRSTAITSVEVNAGGDFTNTHNCPATLAAGSSCTINVAFRPTAVGVRSGVLTAGFSGGSRTVAMTGQGIAAPQPNPTISPALLAFGDVAIGQTSIARSVSILNPGTAAIPLSGMAIDNPAFGIASHSCPAGLLAAGGGCVVNLQFTPQAQGGISGIFSVNAGSVLLAVSLQGNGLVQAGSPVAQVTPSPLVFGTVLNGGVAHQALTLTNTGTGTLQLVTPGIVTANDLYAQFGAQPQGCAGAVLGAGASCQARIYFYPQRAGLQQANVKVHTNAGVVTIIVRGTGGNNQPVGGPGEPLPDPGTPITPAAAVSPLPSASTQEGR